MADMTLAEFRKGYLALAREIGPRAEIYPSFNDSGPILGASVYPLGITSGRRDIEFRVHGETLSELLNALTVKWAEHSETYKRRTIRKMALAIIRTTADLGECTDAALRNCGDFDPGQIALFGQQACADANDIAGRGPFSIITKGGANGAPVEAA